MKASTKKRLPILVLLISGILMMLNNSMAIADLADGLIAYYPFDGNAIDTSGNNNHGTEYGGLQYNPGIKGDSASFDGVDDYVRVSSHPSLNPTNQLSISFWVNVRAFSNEWSPIVHKGGPIIGNYSNREYSVFLNNTSLFYPISAGDNSQQHYDGVCCARLDYWAHFLVIIDRQSHHMKTYVNGILKSDIADSYSNFNNNSYDLLIGSNEEVSALKSPFKGQIDELRIYNRALAGDEIAALYGEGSRFIASTVALVESTFDANLDGWTGHPSELAWASTGGNPNGYAWWGDRGATSLPLKAPAKFLGDWSVLDGIGFISYDQKVFSTGGYSGGPGGHVIGISGPGGSATWYGPSGPRACPCYWITLIAPLTESKWTLNSGSWAGLLANVTVLQIQPEMYNQDFRLGGLVGRDTRVS